MEDAIRDFKSQFPNVGEAVLKGHLESKGIHVQRAKIREAIWAVSGHHELRPPICRRSYSVPGPNALWHIDGNHQMIRWRLVVHGGIDGFSRLITYLKCSSNNRSDTVVNAFYKATEECGVPSCVRSDKGGENVLVWRFMEETKCENRGSYIAGSSVHNTRIADPFTLHYVFLSTINAALTTFKNAWNSHPLSTEQNRTPLQLFMAHAVCDPSFDLTHPGEEYGVDDLDLKKMKTVIQNLRC